MVSEHLTRAWRTLRVIWMISPSRVLSAVLIGMISWGMTGRTLAPPYSSMSKVPWTDKKRYGSCFSRRPSKNTGK